MEGESSSSSTGLYCSSVLLAIIFTLLSKIKSKSYTEGR